MPYSYFEAVLKSEDRRHWTFFELNGCPRELVVPMMLYAITAIQAVLPMTSPPISQRTRNAYISNETVTTVARPGVTLSYFTYSVSSARANLPTTPPAKP